MKFSLSISRCTRTGERSNVIGARARAANSRAVLVSADLEREREPGGRSRADWLTNKFKQEEEKKNNITFEATRNEEETRGDNNE